MGWNFLKSLSGMSIIGLPLRLDDHNGTIGLEPRDVCSSVISQCALSIVFNEFRHTVSESG